MIRLVGKYRYNSKEPTTVVCTYFCRQVVTLALVINVLNLYLYVSIIQCLEENIGSVK